MAKNMKPAVAELDKPKPSLSINEDDYGEIKGLKLDEFVTVTATGKITSLDKNTYSGASNKFSARIELTDLQISPSKKQQTVNTIKALGLKDMK